MTLLELQRRTMKAVSQPLTADYRMRSRTREAKSMRAEAESFIKPNDRLNSFERLEIYNRQYWFRIISALTEDFPGLATLLGDKVFERVAVEYLTAHPSRSFTLRNLGSHLEEWLRAYEQPLAVERELLLDVVRLEWAHIEAFDNAELKPLTLAEVGAMGEDSRLGLQPHVRLLELRYPVDNFVVAVHRDQDEPGMASNAVARRKNVKRTQHLAALQPEQVYLAAHRYDEFVYYKRLEPDAYKILRLIEQGAPLAHALETAANETESDEQTLMENIQRWFANWGELGWLVEKETIAVREA